MGILGLAPPGEVRASSTAQNKPGWQVQVFLERPPREEGVLCEAIGSSEAEGMIVLATLRPSLKRSPRFNLVMSVTMLYSVSGQRAIGLSDSGSSNMSPARA